MLSTYFPLERGPVRILVGIIGFTVCYTLQIASLSFGSLVKFGKAENAARCLCFT